MNTEPTWWSQSADETLGQLDSSSSGLSSVEANRRLVRDGANQLQVVAGTAAWKILVAQLRTVVVALLIVAAVIAGAFGDVLDALAIAAVVVVNTAIGFLTELRAKRAMESLVRLDTPFVTALRDGHQLRLDAHELVRGDVIIVEPGDTIPADARLLESAELRTSEAPLTGESMPIEKTAEIALSVDAPLPERENMLYKGCVIASGRGRAVIVATGMGTEVGRIGGMMQAVTEEDTPLERRLDALGRRLVMLTLVIAGVVVLLGLARGLPLVTIVATGLALAIAAVPEGLPAVATTALAVGLRRMAHRRALVRRLPAVESLGSVTVICTDKTGTLTAGVMTATVCWTAGREVNVGGVGLAPGGKFSIGDEEIDAASYVPLSTLLRSAALSSRGEVSEEDGEWRGVGDPTDVALTVVSRKVGGAFDVQRSSADELGELAFSSERMYSAVFVRDEDRIMAHVKGSPRHLIALSDHWMTEDGLRARDDETTAMLLARNNDLADRGLRVIALAVGEVPEANESALRHLTFLGFVGMQDPPAPGVKETIATFHAAGIRTVMLTGDQRRTAAAIGEELGLRRPGDEAVDGRELANLSEEALAERMERITVFARISPEDKLRIVTGFQRAGEIVAMLGDGVNDAPALRKADVGVAMGTRGSDVAKEAAAVVLQDDHFATIAAAVEEGRVIFDNIRKFIFYLFSCNLAEVLVLFVAVSVALPLPLLPIHLLWLNLVTDTAPALALAFEPAEPGVMRRAPRDPRRAILSASFLRSIAFYAVLIAVVALAAFVLVTRNGDGTTEHAQTVVFMTLAFAQLFHLGNARSLDPVLKPHRVVANRPALAAVVLVIAAQLMAVYWSPLAEILGTTALGARDWMVILPLAFLPAVVGQSMRWARRRGAPGVPSLDRRRRSKESPSE